MTSRRRLAFTAAAVWFALEAALAAPPSAPPVSHLADTRSNSADAPLAVLQVAILQATSEALTSSSPDAKARQEAVVSLGRAIEAALAQRPVAALLEQETVASARSAFGRVSSRALSSHVDALTASFDASLREQEDVDIDGFVELLALGDAKLRIRELAKAGDEAGLERELAARDPAKAATWAKQLVKVTQMTRERVALDQRFSESDKVALEAMLVAVAVGDPSSLRAHVARVQALSDLQPSIAGGLAIAGGPEAWSILLDSWKEASSLFHGEERFIGMERLQAIGRGLQRTNQDARPLFKVIKSELDDFPPLPHGAAAYRDICTGYSHVLNVRFREAPDEVMPLALAFAALLSKPSEGDSEEWTATRRAMLARSLQSFTHPDLCRVALPAIAAAIPGSGDAMRFLGDLIVTYPRYVAEDEGRATMHPALVAAIVAASASPHTCNDAMSMMVAYGSLADAEALCEIAAANVRVAPLAVVAIVNAGCAGADTTLAALAAERPFLGQLPRGKAERVEAARANVERSIALWRENKHNAAPEAVEDALKSLAAIQRTLRQENDFEFTQAIAARDLKILSGLRSSNVEEVVVAAEAVGAGGRSGDFPSWRWEDRQMASAIIDALKSLPEGVERELRNAVERALVDALLRLGTLDAIEYLRSRLTREPAASDLGAYLRANEARLEYPRSSLSPES